MITVTGSWEALLPCNLILCDESLLLWQFTEMINGNRSKFSKLSGVNLLSCCCCCCCLIGIFNSIIAYHPLKNELLLENMRPANLELSKGFYIGGCVYHIRQAFIWTLLVNVINTIQLFTWLHLVLYIMIFMVCRRWIWLLPIHFLQQHQHVNDVTIDLINLDPARVESLFPEVHLFEKKIYTHITLLIVFCCYITSFKFILWEFMALGVEDRYLHNNLSTQKSKH